MDSLSQLSPALKNNLHDLVDFHEYVKYSKEYKSKQAYTCGPFEHSEEHKLLGNNGTQYEINEYGFRGEWTLDNKKRIGVFGDSCTFGIGVDKTDTFVVQLQNKMLDSSVFNLGMVGSSIDNIAKCYSVSQRLLDFDYVLMLLPTYTRFCWPEYDNEWKHSNFLFTGLDPENKKHLSYANNYNEELEVSRTINYLNWIYDVYKNSKAKHLSIWSWDKYTNDVIKNVLPDVFANINPTDVEIDHARDHQHPGPKTHSKIAKLWYDNLLGNL